MNEGAHFFPNAWNRDTLVPTKMFTQIFERNEATISVCFFRFVQLFPASNRTMQWQPPQLNAFRAEKHEVNVGSEITEKKIHPAKWMKYLSYKQTSGTRFARKEENKRLYLWIAFHMNKCRFRIQFSFNLISITTAPDFHIQVWWNSQHKSKCKIELRQTIIFGNKFDWLDRSEPSNEEWIDNKIIKSEQND